MGIVARTLVLFLSLIGYIWYFSGKIRTEFAVGLTMSGIISVLFFAGILNLLPETAFLLCAIGIGLGILSLKKKFPIKNLLTFGTIYFLLMCAFLVFRLRGCLFLQQDNFSHWATVVKSMLIYDRFPNFANKNIRFSSYPLGTACWLYYFTRISGLRAEWVQMLAQNMLFLGMAIALFPLAKKIQSRLLVSFAIFMMLFGNYSIYDLYVDNMLAVTAVSAIAYGIYYRNTLNEKIWYLLPWLIFQIMIKNSGILFVLFIIICLSTFIGSKQKIAVICAPVFSLLLWRKHVELVFENGMMSKHAMSIQQFQSVFGQKTKENIQSVIESFLSREFSKKNTFIFLLIFAILLFALFRFLSLENKSVAKRLCLFAVIFYIIHEIGLLGTYIVTMPANEAGILSWYSRYQRTALVFSGGLLVICALFVIESMADNQKYLYSCLAAVVSLCFLYYGIHPLLDYVREQKIGNYHDLLRLDYERVLTENDIPDNNDYIVLKENGYDDNDYLVALTRYLFDARYVQALTLEQFQNNADVWKRYGYLIVLTDDAEVLEYEKELFDTYDSVVDLSLYK